MVTVQSNNKEFYFIKSVTAFAKYLKAIGSDYKYVFMSQLPVKKWQLNRVAKGVYQLKNPSVFFGDEA